MSLKIKFKYERGPLVDDEEVRRMKQKFGHHKKPSQQEETACKRTKTSKEVDVIGEDATSVVSHVKVLQDQYRKTQPDARIVEERMLRTFTWRRREIASGMTVEDAINKYPFLKSPCGLFQEMGRLYDDMNICRRFEDGFRNLVPTGLRLTQKKSPLADLASEEREAALTEDVHEIDFRAAILLLPILFREKHDILVIIGEDPPPSPYPTVQLHDVTDWRSVLTQKVPAVVKLDDIQETVVREEEQGPSDAVNPPALPNMNELLLQFRENLLGFILKSRGKKHLPQTGQQEILDDVKFLFDFFKENYDAFLKYHLETNGFRN